MVVLSATVGVNARPADVTTGPLDATLYDLLYGFLPIFIGRKVAISGNNVQLAATLTDPTALAVQGRWKVNYATVSVVVPLGTPGTVFIFADLSNTGIKGFTLVANVLNTPSAYQVLIATVTVASGAVVPGSLSLAGNVPTDPNAINASGDWRLTQGGASPIRSVYAGAVTDSLIVQNGSVTLPFGMRGATGFPVAPAGGQAVYREDLGAWFRALLASGTVTTAITGTGTQTVTTSAPHNLAIGDLVTIGAETVTIAAVPTTTQFTASWGSAHAGSSAYSAVAWRQAGDAYWATVAIAPVAPPYGYRYRNLTDYLTYRWTGAAYQRVGAKVIDLAFVLGSDVSVTPTVGSWVDVIANQTFTVLDPASWVDVRVRSSSEVNNGVAVGLFATRAQLDSSGSPQASQFIYLGGGIAAANGYVNPFSGGAPTRPLTALVAGVHTIKLQIYAGTAGSPAFLCSAASVVGYFLNIDVVETLP